MGFPSYPAFFRSFVLSFVRSFVVVRCQLGGWGTTYSKLLFGAAAAVRGFNVFFLCHMFVLGVCSPCDHVVPRDPRNVCREKHTGELRHNIIYIYIIRTTHTAAAAAAVRLFFLFFVLDDVSLNWAQTPPTRGRWWD